MQYLNNVSVAHAYHNAKLNENKINMTMSKETGTTRSEKKKDKMTNKKLVGIEPEKREKD